MSEPAKKRPRLGDSLRTSNSNFSQLFTSQDLEEPGDLRSGLLFSSIDKPAADNSFMNPNPNRSANALDLRSSTGLGDLGLSQTWSEFDFGRELGSSSFSMPPQPASSEQSSAPPVAATPAASSSSSSSSSSGDPNQPPSVAPSATTTAPAPAANNSGAPYPNSNPPSSNPYSYSNPYSTSEYAQYPYYFAAGQNQQQPPQQQPPQQQQPYPPQHQPRSGSFSGDVTTSTQHTSSAPKMPGTFDHLAHHQPPPHYHHHSQPHHQQQMPPHQQQQQVGSPNPPWFVEYMFVVAPPMFEGELMNLQDDFKNRLRKQMEMIKDDLKSDIPIESKGDNLESMITNTENDLNRIRIRLDYLFDNSIIPPLTLNNLVSLKRQVGIETQQLWLYKSELKYYREGMNGSPPFGFLVLAKQPFPKPVKKNIKVCGADGAHEEPTLVRLLSFSGIKVTPCSKVKASVIFEDCHENATFISDSVDMDDHGFASFYSLKFDKATRKRVAKLQFSMDATISTPKGSLQTPIQSESSSPFIVFTNESQWEESESILLKKDCFTQPEISFERLANFLQIHFLRSTRQDPTKPDRGLSIHDLNYLARQRFENKRVLTKSDVDTFLLWFGKVVRRIRHHQSFHTLWVKGLVYGFISRDECERLLETKPPGTFLIRFSETAVSKVVISSVHGDLGGERKFEHMLVAPRVNETHTRLLDVLRKGYKWTTTVVVDTDFQSDLGQTIELEDKDKVFKDHYGKQLEPKGVVGDYLLDDNEIKE